MTFLSGNTLTDFLRVSVPSRRQDERATGIILRHSQNSKAVKQPIIEGNYSLQNTISRHQLQWV